LTNLSSFVWTDKWLIFLPKCHVTLRVCTQLWTVFSTFDPDYRTSELTVTRLESVYSTYKITWDCRWCWKCFWLARHHTSWVYFWMSCIKQRECTEVILYPWEAACLKDPEIWASTDPPPACQCCWEWHSLWCGGLPDYDASQWLYNPSLLQHDFFPFQPVKDWLKDFHFRDAAEVQLASEMHFIRLHVLVSTIVLDICINGSRNV
jgi:hypothetical protein